MTTKTKVLIKLKCNDCQKINYYFWKRKDADYKLSLKKYCHKCKKHTSHKEAKK